ncbi:MAG: sarcosine oxidase [Alphaproteobacteria bacterium]|nr:sarcosine oxidase [Alphaproteobacteria bacterium]
MIEKTSALHFDHQIGLFGDYEGKNNLLKIKELKNLNIYQIAKFKKSTIDVSQIKINDLPLPLSNPLVSYNNDTRILWTGPDTWICISSNHLKDKITSVFNESDFGVTDLSHSRAAIQIQGENTFDVLKKGSPLNFNDNHFTVNNSANTTYNGINILIDFVNSDPKTMNIYSLRSFGGSFYHSFTDSALEYGYEGI